jgi:hypothetical protein
MTVSSLVAVPTLKLCPLVSGQLAEVIQTAVGGGMLMKKSHTMSAYIPHCN